MHFILIHTFDLAVMKQTHIKYLKSHDDNENQMIIMHWAVRTVSYWECCQSKTEMKTILIQWGRWKMVLSKAFNIPDPFAIYRIDCIIVRITH